MRLTQEVYDYIEQQAGNGFNEKFENIILEAKKGESERKKELARLDKQIRKQQQKQNLVFSQLTNFDYFLNSFEAASKSLNDAGLSLQRIEEVENNIKEIDNE